MARTIATTMPSRSGMTVRTRCWPRRTAIVSRLSATHPKSKILVPGGMSDPLFDGRLIGGAWFERRLLSGGLAVAGDQRRQVIERGRVLAFLHLAGDGLDRQEALGPSIPVDDDAGLDVGVEHHR